MRKGVFENSHLGERQEMTYPSSQALAVRRGGRHTECACYFFLSFALLPSAIAERLVVRASIKECQAKGLTYD
jgi:hypothetical protein